MKAIVMLLSGKFFSPKKLSTGGGGVLFNMLLSGKTFRFVGKVLPLGPPKKHGSHGATEIIAPRISSWQSGIIKTAPYSANCACCP